MFKNETNDRWLLVVIAGFCWSSAAQASIPTVSLSLDPPNQMVFVDDVVYIDLLAISDGDTPADFGTIDAIVDWDPVYLELLGFTTVNAEFSWFQEGFLPDPDGINDDLLDGDAMYTALAAPGGPAASAPPLPDSLIYTTLCFKVLAETSGTAVQYTEFLGTFGKTRVMSFDSPNEEITGTISGMAVIKVIPEPASLMMLVAGSFCVTWRRRRVERRPG